MNKAIKHKKCVIIDRCNVHAKERKMWLTDAKKAGVTRFEAVYLNPGVEECKRRVRERKKHPTLSAENGDAVIDDFAKSLAAPESWEGFEKISVVTNSDEYKQLVKDYQAYEINKKPL
jgi:predicted kinase